MRKNNLRVRVFLTFAVLSLFLSGPVRIFGNWGMEVGRANEGDNARLLQDWLVMKMAENRIKSAVARPLAKERQKQLLGLSAGDGSTAAELLDGVYSWWLKEVMTPAQLIALNPAASCDEATLAVSTLLSMMRQRQLLGIEDDDKRAAELMQILEASGRMVIQRCRDEALDECVATGRIRQILELHLAQERQSQLTFGNITDAESWAQDALGQCAIYELHFVSTTKIAMPTVETVRDGKVAIRFDPSAGGIKEMMQAGRLGDFLHGQTKDSPFFVSVKCSMPGLAALTCSPGADSVPVTSRIQLLDMKHKEFYVENGISKVKDRIGEDKFQFEFAGGTFELQGVLKAAYNKDVQIPLQFGNSFYIAHRKDQIGPGKDTGVRVEQNKRGAYPVIFEFTYADQNTVGDAAISDSTEFQLIHKPKPKPFPARPPESIRKPLIPRPG